MEQQKLTRGTDEIRVNVKDSSELKYWADKFDVSQDEIISAVRKAGDSLTALQRQLKKNPIYTTVLD
ncbi:hypothetical protein D3C80_2128300 [compost metagenome]|jgi:hypothetical protein